jgi:hypothetical protein
VADVLVDTDVFIDHLRGARALKPDGHRLHYSVITRAELFSGARGVREAAVLLAPLAEVPVDRTIAERAGRIRRENGLRLPDALIAATAIVRSMMLATRNRKDFDRVPDLAVFAGTED